MYNQSIECKSWFYHDKPQLVTGQELKLRREPTNQHDKNAVEILTEGGLKVGYIPAHMAAEVSSMLNNGTVLFVSVMEPYDAELETAPWLHVQDLEAKLACEDSQGSTVSKLVLIGVPILVLLSIGGCVALTIG